MTKVEDLMTEKVISVNPETKLGDAVAILTKNNFNGIPVVDKQNTLVGLLTERDMMSNKSYMHLATLLKLLNEIKFYKKDNSPIKDDLQKVLAMKVADLMDPSPATLRPSDSIEEATRLFADPKINPIPIVNGQKKLIGILAISDLTKLYSVSIRHSLDNTQADENIENFIKDFEKEFVVVTKFRTRTWMIVSILFAVIGFLIAMFFIIRVNF